MSKNPRRPGLELLIRKPPGQGGASGGFELKVLDRDQAFLRLRPQRARAVPVEENTIDEVSGRVHVVRFRIGGSEKYLRLNPEEHFLYRHMDGVHTMQDIAAAFFFQFHRFDTDLLRGVLRKARRLGLVEVRRTSLLRSRRAEEEPSRWTRWLRAAEWRWEAGADRAFGALAAHVGLLFTRGLLPLHLVVGGLGLGTYLAGRWSGGLGHFAGPSTWLAAFVLVLPAVAVVHELGHGLACKAAGRRVQAVGLAFLDDLVPSVYVDVSDMWMAPRLPRIGAILAGPLTNLVLGAVCAVLARGTSHAGGAAALTVLADANLAVALYTLWPFHIVREDGYEALTDLVRVPALRGRAWRMVSGWATGAPPDPGPGLRLRLLFGGWLLGLALTLAGLVAWAGAWAWTTWAWTTWG